MLTNEQLLRWWKREELKQVVNKLYRKRKKGDKK